LEETLFRFLLRESQGLFVRRARLDRLSQPTAQIRPGGMRQVVGSQFAAREDRVN
jgi:hypothetical protein